MLKKILLLNTLYLIIAASALCFDEEDIAKIEYSKYGQIYSDNSISERLNRLENDFFGMSQTGDIDSRISMLSKLAENTHRTAIIDPLKDYYPSKKKSSVENLWDRVSSGFSDNGVITGYTPPIYNQGYSNNIYKNELMNSLNNLNGYCPYRNNYNKRFFNRFFNNSDNLLNKKVNNRRITPPYGYRNYNPYQNRVNRSYYQIPPSISTRSSVHIIED